VNARTIHEASIGHGARRVDARPGGREQSFDQRSEIVGCSKTNSGTVQHAVAFDPYGIGAVHEHVGHQRIPHQAAEGAETIDGVGEACDLVAKLIRRDLAGHQLTKSETTLGGIELGELIALEHQFVKIPVHVSTSAPARRPTARP